MDKDSIYKIIGYNGEYNNNVRKKLKKLLKQYHPDHNKGQENVFQLLTNIKKELESEKKLTLENINSKAINDKDKENYQKNLVSLGIIKKELQVKLEDKYYEISLYREKYNTLYERSIQAENRICQNKDFVNYFKLVRFRYISYTIFLSILVLIFIIKQNIWLLLIILLLSIMGLIYVCYIVLHVKKTLLLNRNYYKKFLIIEKKLGNLKKTIQKISDDILSLKRELNKIDDSIRFYNNQIDYLDK